MISIIIDIITIHLCFSFSNYALVFVMDIYKPLLNGL